MELQGNNQMPRKLKEQREVENKGLTIIPKAERYMQYMLDLIFKLPRTEKRSENYEKS